jgi:hypothetical protein
MSDNLTFAELEAQHVELLPARTVLSLMNPAAGGRSGTGGSAGSAQQGSGFNWMSGFGLYGGTGTATFGTATAGKPG